MKTLALLLLLPLSAAADMAAPDFTVTTKSKSGALEIVATPPAAHHINTKAPMQADDGATKIKPKSANEHKAVFHVPGLANRSLDVGLYLCDNANTICEKHVVTATWNGPVDNVGAAKPAAGAADTPAAPAGSPKKPEKTKTDQHGFIDNDPEAALALALRDKKPLMIDFYGIWCPPCNMMEEEIYSKSEFARATKNFVKLKLDADAEVSWALKSKYKVGGYPTVVFTSPEGDEILRVVGSRPLKDFLAEIGKAWDQRASSFEALKAKAEAGDEKAADAVGSMMLERGDFESAAKFLEHTKTQHEKLYEARIGLLDDQASADKEAEAKLVETLERSIEEYPLSPESLERRGKLADLYEARKAVEQRKKTLLALVSTGKELIANPKLMIGHDMTAADVWQTIADTQEKLENPGEAKNAWAKGAEEYRKQVARVGQGKLERGYNLERAYCLYKSGDVAQAEDLYSTLEKKFSKEFTFYYAHGRMNLELKKTDRALPLAKNAYEYSYGDNRLRAAHLLARTYDAAGKKSDALDVIRKTLTSTAVPSDSTIRTHRYVKQLKSLEQTLVAEK